MVTRLSARRLICLWMCTVAIGLFAFNLTVPPLEPSFANGQTRPVSGLFELLGKQFNTLRAQYQDMTYAELRSRLEPEPNYLEALPFNPTEARYFDLVQHRLELSEQERALFVQNGFVTIDQGRGLSFPAAYQQVYASDLPVFISSDSILHALHRSYDEILKELETSYFRSTLDEILANCQTALAKRAADSLPQLRDNLRDVDLYLGVARKLLLALPKSPQVEFIGGLQLPIPPAASVNDATVPVKYSVLGREAAIDTVMADIDSLRMQTPNNGYVTKIYGGKRYVDYSQFRPRGHYTESAELTAYFRCLMWLCASCDCS